ncbi:HK97 family phage prohead protease [Allomesorhizobium camelthorni]|uniref:HK97 family phage prohead protease n=1 Tax=Allomesorhizobium camelthorni TaxID=475069 RepID=A0A6G4W8F6_9HYPH|nr:HK97 family phage prohead protease [Mesorhizobium camelthorni]NGO50440.1 HK97 family phage prohead protease [Mesorhizobium camelthorni]
MDRYQADFEFKFATGAKDGTFSGYGAIFGNVDSYGDVIERGAFKESLRTWESKGKLPPMLLQHGGFFGPVDDMLPVGKWTSMEENTKGLKVEGELFALSTDRGQLIYEGMKAGSLDGLSIGYRAKKFTVGTKPTDPTRTLHEVELRELSIVTFPANDKAVVGAVKSADIDALNTISDFEDFLREAGGPAWSKKTVRDFVSRFKKVVRREAGDDQDVAAGLLESIRSTRKLIIPNR